MDQDCHNCKHIDNHELDGPCKDCVSVHTMTKWEPVLC